ncbi:MAG: Unknown protein [uncultured Sulfurovum sp.]|uniref:Uncharacterized protein n=1 Tax=uncultured Sulfurovum sp. TaxID=269237 RepID=A0A6S6S6V4_9BACT|nr:MAG: Unknown protein [uncultured Sulfurovum sp.]
MLRSDILREMSNIILRHERWLKRMDHLTSGLPVDQQLVNIEKTLYFYASWLNNKNCKLRTSYHTNPLVEQIEHHYNELNKFYTEIDNLYFILPKNRNFLHIITTFNKQKLTAVEAMKARQYFQNILESSNTIFTLFHQLKEQSKYISYYDELIKP